jgi:hypothetical protein
MIEAKPLSEQECLEANLPPKGIFPFEVVTTREKTSEKVGAFFSLRMTLKLPNDKTHTIFDALFFTERMMWKTRHFYSAVGRMDIYDSGKFQAQDCDFLKGFAEIDHRVKKDTGEVEGYVKDYITPEAPPAEEAPFFDDDVPNM